jgi:hypothetical protein
VLRENNPELAHHEMEVLEVGAVVLKDTGLYLASAVELLAELGLVGRGDKHEFVVSHFLPREAIKGSVLV